MTGSALLGCILGTVAGALDNQTEVLKPYVPRLQIEWLRDMPQTKYQAVEGSLAFVDISGFTALTESLNRRGKIGAELLRDTLDPIFCALLDEAYRWGAGLLKWGGDAMLLLFEGDGHEHRAARAAWEMQGTIATVGRVRVGGTRVTLRMSIGIATGAIDFFLAGSVHRELLVAGPVATETAMIEGAADAGEIGLSPALAERLAPACVGPPAGEVRLLIAPPDVGEAPAPDVGRVSGVDVASCIPVAAREHVLLERSEPEHRAVTAVFFDLMNTDSLLADVGPLVLAEALDERIRSIQEAADRFGVPFNVTDVSKGSVKVLLTAGAPSTTGHDEEQALRLAREVTDRPGLVPVRAGLDAGHVFTGDFGPPYRRTYAVLGDAINTAARVMVRAEPGQILSTDIVLERSRTVFETTPIEPFAAKGKAEPVKASLVGPIAGRREHRIADTPFVGRIRELEAFGSVLGEVAGGRAWIIEIGGPSGIGKTRLIREALAAGAPDLRVFRATCEEYESSTPYHAVRYLLRELLGLAPDDTPADAERALRAAVAEAEPELVPWVPLLGIPLGLDLPPTPETKAIDERFLREILADVTCRFLAARLDAEPFALVVEDAQFMDDSSSDLLRRVAKAGESLPHALVVARTQVEGVWTDVEDEHLRFLAFDLLPLSERDAAEIVEIATDEQPFRPHEIEELARRSGGSPLFLVELLNVARATGTTELPDSVEAVVTADIDRLSAADRIVLRYASVLGVAFDEDLLAATLVDEVTPDEGLWERLRGLVDRDADGRLRFRNTLVHAVAYEGLPFRRRRELHGRFAEAIELSAASADDEAATLALHFSAAGRLDRTWHYARTGGDRARSIAAHVEAARLYELALSAGRHVRSVAARDRADVLVALGSVREMAGLFDDSYDALRRATVLLKGDPVQQARIYAQRTLARQRTGAHSLALRETTVGLRLVERRQERDAVAARALLRAWRAEILMFQGHARKSIPIAEAAIEEGKAVDEFNALAHAYTALDGAYALLGQPEKAVHEKLALEMFQQRGNSRLAGIYGFNVGGQAYYNGDWDGALERYLRAREDCLRAGDRNNAAYASVCIAELLIGRGELDEAEELLVGARRVLRSSGFAAFALFAEIQLARCLLERGDAKTARSALEWLVGEATAVGYAATVLEAGTYIAHAFAREGLGADGLDALESAVAAAGSEAAMYGAAIERARAACLVELGRSDEAVAALDRALASALEQGLLYEQLLIRRARVEIAGPGGAEPEELSEIERLAELLGIPR